MIKVCEKWSLEDLVAMNEEDMDGILGYYKPNTVPTFAEIHDDPMLEEFAFDGSFGWW